MSVFQCFLLQLAVLFKKVQIFMSLNFNCAELAIFWRFLTCLGRFCRHGVVTLCCHTLISFSSTNAFFHMIIFMYTKLSNYWYPSVCYYLYFSQKVTKSIENAMWLQPTAWLSVVITGSLTSVSLTSLTSLSLNLPSHIDLYHERSSAITSWNQHCIIVCWCYLFPFLRFALAYW